MFSKTISKELEAGCFLVYFSRIGETGGDLFLLWQLLQGNGDSPSSDRTVVTLQPHGAQRNDSHWVRRVAQAWLQESRNSLSPLLFLLQHLLGNHNHEENIWCGSLCKISHATSNTFHSFLVNKVHFREKLLGISTKAVK